MKAATAACRRAFRADQLVELLRELAPGALGMSVTVFDPDLDPDGRFTRLLADVIVEGCAALGR